MNQLELLSSLPVLRRPGQGFVDLYTLVPELIDLHPEWHSDDVAEFVEEKTRHALPAEDLTTLLTLYQRCTRLRQEFGGWDGEGNSA